MSLKCFREKYIGLIGLELAFGEEVLRNVKKNADGTLSGEIQSRGVHSSEFIPFISQIKEINDPNEKKKGFIRACKGFALFMNNASSPEQKEIWREALKKFTGREFQTKKQWDEWLKANEKFLKFSEESGRLEVVDSDREK